MRRSLRAMVAAPVVVTVAFGSLLAAPVANAANNEITVWVDQKRIANYRELFPTGTYAGYTINLVPKDFGKIRDDLATVSADSAPDVISGAHDWTGALAANGLIVKLNVPSATIKSLSPFALQGFRYGSGIYGIPTQIENVAMITNANLIKTQPKTFQQISTQALALKKAGKVTVPFAVPQGANGDAYHMYPMFSGLGGYIFGTNPSGSVNVKTVGLDNPTFRKNQNQINAWNKTGLINSKVDYGIAKTAFTTGKSPFWITGPWESRRSRPCPSSTASPRCPRWSTASLRSRSSAPRVRWSPSTRSSTASRPAPTPSSPSTWPAPSTRRTSPRLTAVPPPTSSRPRPLPIRS